MSVTVTFDLPPEVEKKLRSESRDLKADVKEAYALELYRQEKLSRLELSKILELDRFETNALLQQHKIYVGSLTMEDLDEQARILKAVMGKAKAS